MRPVSATPAKPNWFVPSTGEQAIIDSASGRNDGVDDAGPARDETGGMQNKAGGTRDEARRMLDNADGTPGETRRTLDDADGTHGETNDSVDETGGTDSKTSSAVNQTGGAPGEASGTVDETGGAPGEVSGTVDETGDADSETSSTVNEADGTDGGTGRSISQASGAHDETRRTPGETGGTQDEDEIGGTQGAADGAQSGTYHDADRTHDEAGSATPEAGPEPITAPDAAQEPTTAPEAAREPATTLEAERESVTVPEAERQPITAPGAEPDPATEAEPDPAAEAEHEPAAAPEAEPEPVTAQEAEAGQSAARQPAAGTDATATRDAATSPERKDPDREEPAPGTQAAPGTDTRTTHAQAAGNTQAVTGTQTGLPEAARTPEAPERPERETAATDDGLGAGRRPRSDRDEGKQAADPRSRRADPEQVLAAYPWVFDPETLREQIDDGEFLWVVVDRLTDKLEFAERDAVRARLLSVRAVALRLAGDLDGALEDARSALTHARRAGEPRGIALVQARLAHVLQWRGEYAEADRLYAEAASPELPDRLTAEIHELAGRSAFEQGRYLEAVNHFENALDLRNGADPELVERLELALDSIAARTTEGWGPYPRSREEVLGQVRAPRPVRDGDSGLWGYPGAVPASYEQAEPFAEGLAWVRRPDAPGWELIDEAGETVIDADAGYRAATPFAEGLAWVTREETGGWHAIDRQNRVVVPGGFEEARPFRHGLALVRRDGWGAVDRDGRLVVPPRYRGFATVLAAGDEVDGFTADGLAVVDEGDRYGVVDRSGRLLVSPVHAAVRIHPEAFLVADKYDLWGALDRAGEPMIELRYRDRADLLAEIGRRRPDRRPIV